MREETWWYWDTLHSFWAAERTQTHEMENWHCPLSAQFSILYLCRYQLQRKRVTFSIYFFRQHNNYFTLQKHIYFIAKRLKKVRSYCITKTKNIYTKMWKKSLKTCFLKHFHFSNIDYSNACQSSCTFRHYNSKVKQRLNIWPYELL